MNQNYECEFGYTKFPQAVLRVIKPTMPSSTYLIYEYFVDMTFGFHLPEGSAVLTTYPKIMDATNIASKSTIREGLDRLLLRDLLSPNWANHYIKSYIVNMDELRLINTWINESGLARAKEKYFDDLKIKIIQIAKDMNIQSYKNCTIIVQKLYDLKMLEREVIASKYRLLAHPDFFRTIYIYKEYNKNKNMNNDISSIIMGFDREQRLSLQNLISLSIKGNKEAEEVLNEILQGKGDL